MLPLLSHGQSSNGSLFLGRNNQTTNRPPRKNLKSKDFIVKTEDLTRDKKGKRVYLNDIQTKELTKKLNEFLESFVEVLGIRVGNRQTIETLINEETLLLAKFLRNEQRTWIPRIS